MTRSRRPSVALLLAALAVATAVSRADAQSLTGFVEVTAARTSETQRQPSVPDSETDLDTFIQRINLLYTQPLGPSLNLLLGGDFERIANDGTVLDAPTDSVQARFRPFARLRYSTPAFRLDAGAERSATRFRSFDVRSELVRDTYSFFTGWYPDQNNYLQLYGGRSDEQDENRLLRDQTEDRLQLNGQLRPWRPFSLQARAGISQLEDRVANTTVDTNTQSARLIYGDTFWRGRLSVSADYNWNRFESETRGSAFVEVPLLATAGLSLISDLPEDVVLAPNAALVDDNRATAAGLDIGAVPPTGDDRPRNLGVDFGVATFVNMFRVWVDREVRAEVAPSFSWEIWTSDDNRFWTRATVLSSAPFGPFENYFELVFPGVTARFVKVVVEPLDPTAPFASEYPSLGITELDPIDRRFVTEDGQGFSRTSEFVSTNARLRLTERPLLFYDLSYLDSDADPGTRRWTLTNALLLTHSFARAWSLAARLAKEDGEEPEGTRDSLQYSASLGYAPMPTFRSNLLASGRREDVGARREDTDTVILSTIATLYRGVDLNVSVGGSRLRYEDGRETDATLINGLLTLTPNRYLTVSLLYQDDSRTLRSEDEPEIRQPGRVWEVSATVSPLTTLYAFASYRSEDRAGTGERQFRNYNISWAPFPYGSLRFNFLYNEQYETTSDALSRVWGPSLRWNVTLRSYVDVSYQNVSSDSEVQEFERGVYTATLRLGF